MLNLDSVENIKKLDAGNILGSIESLPNQILQAWEEIKTSKIPNSCSLAKNVVIAGMGGSSLGGRIIDALTAERARVPIEVFTEYHLPNYVSRDTLVIVSSYSGNTEETIYDFNEAYKKGAQIFGITTGGKLAEILRKGSIPSYIFDPKNNPSGQPRMSLGYSITAILSLLAKCEFISLSEAEIKEIVATTKTFLQDFGIEKGSHENIAKSLAGKLFHKIPVLIASEHLVGAVHTVRNQFNENSKTFSAFFDIPELNHHLMEGLRNPAEAKRFLEFLFIESELYSPHVKARYPITQEVVQKNEVSYSVYKTISSKKLYQIFEILVLGSYLSFYLAMLYEIDPAPIPWVDYFKEKMLV